MPQQKSDKHRSAEQYEEKRASKHFSSIIILLIFVAIPVTLAWNWAQDNVFNTLSPVVDRHAENAATVMERARNGTSANDMAYSVVGQRDARIDALKAEGTNQRGEIVLRITVDNDSNLFTFSKGRVQRCYIYEFPFSTPKGLTAKKIACQQGEPLTLSAPVKQYYKPARDLP